MNILVDAHVFDGKYQGTRTYLKGLYSNLIPIAKEWNFYIVATDLDNLRKEFGDYPNVEFVPLYNNNKFYRLLIEFPLIIKKYKIHYAHFQYICPPLKNCKIILTIHDILFEQPEFKHYFPVRYRIVNGILFKWSSKRANIILTVSEYSKLKIAQIYSIKDDKIYITPNAVSVNKSDDPLNKRFFNKYGKFILYVSRVEPRKNHLNLLKAFIDLNLALQDYKLIFIGKSDIPYPELEAYLDLNKNIIGNNVVWLDSIPNDELNLYYRNCELFVFPSYAEGFGIPPLEAIANKCKVLVSKDTAMGDFGLPNELTFDPANLEELKRKILFQLKTPNVELHIYDHVLTKYNWGNIAENYYNFLLEHIEK